MKIKPRGILKILAICLGAFVLVCLLAVAFLAVSNRNLPVASANPERLGDNEKALLYEALYLKRTLGDAVWPGWARADIPMIAFNEKYAFLVNYPNPPPGWVKVPQNLQSGAEWEPVPGDDFFGEVYYRQRLAGEGQSPQNFAALVGDRWVGSMTTKEWSIIGLVNQLKEDMPGPVKGVFPYRLFVGRMIRGSDGYISLVMHENFHAFTGMSAPARLAGAENANAYSNSYPWDDQSLQESWKSELDLLAQGAKAAWGDGSDAEVKDLARRFLAQRDGRRTTFKLTPGLAEFEKQREWLEGLARYVELDIWRQAYLTSGYDPIPAVLEDPDFKNYAGFESRWKDEINQFKYMVDDEGDGRFYYTGMAQAVMLDRLLPGWKERALQEGVWLEDLLREATGN